MQTPPEIVKLDEDIRAYVATGGRNEMVMEWGLVIAAHVLHDDGTSSTSYYVRSSPEMAHHRILGLFDYATMVVHNQPDKA